MLVEQLDDGGPPRLYCSPAHRTAARKLRHTARLEATDAVSPTASWMVSPVSLLSPEGTGTAQRKIVLKPVKRAKAARPTGDRRKLAALLRQRAVASIAVASLVAGGSGYILTEAAAPVAPPQPPPPPTVDPQTVALEADLWAGRAEVVLASINQQLDALAQTEATWMRLPEEIRNQMPPAVRALLDRKVLLEQQRAMLMSQLAALRALPGVTTDLATAQAQLDAVERALNAAPAAPTAPEQTEAVRLLSKQRELRLQQRDHNAQELANLRNGVEEALRTPLPDVGDRTTPLVQQVMALIERRSDDTGDNHHNSDPAPLAARREEPPALARRSSATPERNSVSVTAPPDPQRSVRAVLISDGNGGGRQDSHRDSHQDARGGGNGQDDNGHAGGNGSGGPVRQVVTSTVGAVGEVLGGSDGAKSADDNNRERRSGHNVDGNDKGNDRRGDKGDGGGKDHGGKNDGGEVHGDAPVARTISNVTSSVTGAVLGSDDRADQKDQGGEDNKSDKNNKSGKAEQDNEAGRNDRRDERASAGQGDGSRPVGKAERQRQRDAAEYVSAVTIGLGSGNDQRGSGGDDRRSRDHGSSRAGSGDNGNGDRAGSRGERGSDRGSDARSGRGGGNDSGGGNASNSRSSNTSGGSDNKSNSRSSNNGKNKGGDNNGKNNGKGNGGNISGKNKGRSSGGGS